MRDTKKPNITGKATLLALAQVAAIGCNAPLDDSAEQASAGGAAVAVQALEQEQVSRLYAALPPTDPIRAAGHGMIVTSDGRVIEPTPDFVRTTQRYYIDRLYNESSVEVQQEYARERANWEPTVGEAREFARRGGIIDWFLLQVRPVDAAKLDARNRFLVYAMEPEDAAFVVGTSSRADYLQECKAAGVPTPPDWGNDPAALGWTLGGPLDTTDFLNKGPATVWYKVSTDPERPGLCMALPRVQTGEVQEQTPDGQWVTRRKQQIGLLGVICQGKTSSQACFWDNDGAFELPLTQVKTIANDFKSAADLAAKGDVCTSCHRGENIFIIHPGTNLDIDKKTHAAGWKFKKSESHVRANDWVNPIVVNDWPKNERWSEAEQRALLNVPLVDDEMRPETSCLDCHSEGGEGGGLGRLDDSDYCSAVMWSALDPSTATMPPNDYLLGINAWKDKPHSPSEGHRNHFLEACGLQ